MRLSNEKKIRINGWATVDGHFYKHPPIGTFGQGCYPDLHKAYLIIKVNDRKGENKMNLSDRNKTVNEIVGLKKLSEILGWEKKIVKCSCVDVFTPDPEDIPCSCGARENLISNTALTSCDREIDREALANHISNALCDCKEDPSTGERSQCRFCYDIKGYEKDLAEAIISTMPTWLKPIGRK